MEAYDLSYIFIISIVLLGLYLVISYIVLTQYAKRFYKNVSGWLVLKEWWSIEKFNGRLIDITSKKFSIVQPKNHPFDSKLYFMFVAPLRVLLGLLLVYLYYSLRK